MVISARERRLSQRLVREWGLVHLNQQLIAEIGSRVVDGPFRGLVLVPATHLEHVGPYLLGTYESELKPWWDRLLKMPFSQIVDVGAKFGYYAVGLARHFPEVPVVAFDPDSWARKITGQMAKVNGASNVLCKRYCTPAWLDLHLQPGALIVSDCEGYEGHLFGGARIAALASATLLIELHEAAVSGVTAAIRSAFRSTHVFEEIDSRSDTPAVTIQTSLTREQMRQAATEIRVAQKWLLLTPNTAAARP